MPSEPKPRPVAIGIACLLVAFGSGAADEFEGVYRVGPMTCTATPGKMVYIVRCTDGHGPRNYFSLSPFGDNTFFAKAEDEKPDTGSSDAVLAEDPDRFVFDDHRLRTGTFYGSDGRRFPVVKEADAGTAPGAR